METMRTSVDQMSDSLRTAFHYLYLSETDHVVRLSAENELFEYGLGNGLTVSEINRIYLEAMDPDSELQPEYEITEVKEN